MKKIIKDDEIVLKEKEAVYTDNDKLPKKHRNKKEAFAVREDEALRKENKKVFEMSDGTMQAVFYPEPVHFYDKKKKSFIEIDNTVEDEEDGKHVRNKKNKFVARFNKETDNDELFSVENEGFTIKISTKEHPRRKIKKKKPKITKSEAEQSVGKIDRITFGDIESSTDFDYTVHADRVKEDIIIKNRKPSYTYTFVIEHTGLKAEAVEEEKRLSFKHGKKELFSIPAPFMYDAQEKVSTAVFYELETVGEGKSILKIIADDEWINDDKRVFPVVIDPQIVISGISKTTTYSWSDDTMSSTSLHVIGNTSAGGSKNRMYMKIASAEITGNPRIKKAEITLNQHSSSLPSTEVHRIGAYKITDVFTSGECQCPSFEEIPVDYARAQSGNVSYVFDVTKVFDDYYNGMIPTPAVVFKMMDETVDSVHYVKIYGNSYSATGPVLKVTYENTYGMSPSSRTHTHSLGRLGTASVDLQTGALNIESEDFAWQGIRKPVTIKHYYSNSLGNRKYTKNSSIRLNVADFSGMALGYGWRLNYMQSMVESTFIIDGESITGYIYTDETGNEIYFKESGVVDGCTLYKDVGDSGYEYCADNRRLTVGQDYYFFDTEGRLIKITDGKTPETKIDIIYDSAGKITQITDGVGRAFNFAYTAVSTYGNQLTSITAPDQSTIQYSYSAGRLCKVIYPNGQIANISNTGTEIEEIVLQTSDEVNLYKVSYGYNTKYGMSNNCVYRVAEYGYTGSAWTLGKRATYYSSTSSMQTSVQISCSGESTKNVVYTFDEDGNIVGNYESTSSGNNQLSDIGEGIDPFISDKGANYNAENLLRNHNFENFADGSFANWTSINESELEIAQNTKSAKFGKSCAYIDTYNSTSELDSGIYQSVSLPAGNYTFSAYVKSNKTKFENTGVYLRVRNSANTVIAQSELKNYYDRNYTRLSVPFTISSATTVKCEILISGIYDAFIDGAQLERGECATTYNMLENSGFENSLDGWDYTSGVTSMSSGKFNMSKSMAISGSLDNERYAKQSVIVDKIKGNRENFTLSGWAKAPCIAKKERYGEKEPQFRLKAVIRYEYCNECGIKDEEFYADFSPYTDGWQYASVQFSKSKKETVESVTVYCEYSYAIGEAYFDNIQLLRDTIDSDYEFVNESVVNDDEEENTTSTEDEDEIQFEEAVDEYGNALTETTYTDGEFGTIYKGYQYANSGNDISQEIDQKGGCTFHTVEGSTSKVQSTVDRCDNETSYEYDNAGRTTKVISKQGNGTGAVTKATVSYEYDTFDNMTKITRGDGMKYDLVYDKFHNLESIGITGKNEKLITYQYNGSGEKVKKMTYANGDYADLTYNSTGQLISEKWYNSGNTLISNYKYVYDSVGNIVRSIDKTKLIEYNYYYEEGAIVRSTESTITLNGDIVTSKTPVNTVFYNYVNGKLVKKSIIDSSGKEFTYRYEYTDKDEVILKCTVDGKQVLSHSKVDGFGRKVFDELQLGKGFVSRQFTYLAGETTSAHVANEKLKSSPVTNLVSQIVLSDGTTLSYGYDAEERITSVVEKYTVDDDTVTNTTTYTYDALGQLVTENLNNSPVSVTYDNYGNIKSKNGKTYTYGNSVWKDLLTSYDGQSITYDAQGNPTSYLGHTLTWEKGRQLKSYDSNTYTYNANGIRTSKTVGGVKHTYILDGTKILRETWGSNTLIPLYNNEESVCGIIYNDTPYYFFKNLQGDIIAIVDKEAATVARYSYDAWGVPTVVFDTSDCSISTINPFRYRGYYYDEEIGLYYLQSRYYDADVGRFVKSDIPEMMLLQLEKAIGTNLYTYCNNNPINGSDPMGILDAAGVANWLSASSVFAMFAESLYTAFSATMTKIGLYITSFLTPKVTAAFWWQPWVIVGIVVAAVAIILAAVSIARSQAISKADAKIKSTVKRNSPDQYWSANFKFGYVDIGRALTYTQAVKEVAAGRNVFTVTKAQAYAVAFAAGGNATPMFHLKHKNQTGYYDHYHVKGHTNDSHVWYLF